MVEAHDSRSITVWLERLRHGDADALDRLVPLLYGELRRVARRQLAREAGITLSATALVHEAYLRLVQQRRLDPADTQDFLGIAARVMRRVLVDRARRRHRLKRAPEVPGRVSQEVPVDRGEERDMDELLAVDALLDRLQLLDPRAARIVEYRIFGGLTVDEIALALGVSCRTVQRSWTMARAWLRAEVARDTRPNGCPEAGPGRADA